MAFGLTMRKLNSPSCGPHGPSPLPGTTSLTLGSRHPYTGVLPLELPLAPNQLPVLAPAWSPSPHERSPLKSPNLCFADCSLFFV